MMDDIQKLEQAIDAQEALRPLLGDAVVDTVVATLHQQLASLRRQQLAPLRESMPVSDQRKLVTVLFADATGFTHIAEMMDAEDVREMMNMLWQGIDSAILANGGRIDKHIGDAVMATWGTEGGREDDPERALRAALAMQQAAANFRFEDLKLAGRIKAAILSNVRSLSLRVGVHTGMVLLGKVGTIGEVTVMGDTVNVAARLQEHAPAGGILISHETYRQVRGIFDLLPQAPLIVKGKSEPMQVYLVQKARPRAFRLGTRGVEGVETRMIGRDAELALLQQALLDVQGQGRLQAFTLVGEAGIGKSRLMHEFHSWADLLPQTWRFFKGRASEESRQLPYALLRDLLSFRFEIQDSDPQAVARQKLEHGIREFLAGDVQAEAKAHFVGHLVGFDFSDSPHLQNLAEDKAQLRERAFRYLVQLIAATSRLYPGDAAPASGLQVPIAILLEDLHWADDASLDALTYILQHCQALPVLLVGTARPALFERYALGEGIAGHRLLNLQALSREDSQRLVNEILRKMERIPPGLRDLIVQGADGNPFYLEELIKMLIDEQVILVEDESWQVQEGRLAEMHVPSTLSGVLQARLDGLPASERETLQRASVIGRVFWDQAVSSLDMRPGQALAISQKETPGGEAPLQVFLQHHLDALRRRELIFRRDNSVFDGTREYLFKHAILRDVTYETVLKRLRRVYHAQAAGWLVAKSGDRVQEYAGLIAEHYERAGDLPGAVEWYSQAAAQAQETYAIEAAIGYYQKALKLSENLTSNWEARQVWYEELAELLRMRTSYTQAEQIYRFMLAEAQMHDNLVGQARAYNGISFVLENQGNHRASLENARQAESIARQAGEAGMVELATALYKQGGSYYFLGDANAALHFAEQMLSLCDRLGDFPAARRTRARCYNLLGTANEMLGRIAQVIHYRQQSLNIFRELGDQRYVAMMWGNLGSTYISCGDYPAAMVCYQDGLRLAKEIGAAHLEAGSLEGIGIAHLYLKQYLEAERCFRQLLESSGENLAHYRDLHASLAEALLGQKRTADALDVAQEAVRLARQSERPEDIGVTLRVLGNCIGRARAELNLQPDEQGALPEPRACYQESAQIFSASGDILLRAQTLQDWARYELHYGGDIQRGKDLWQEARRIYEQFELPLKIAEMDAEG